MGYDVSLCVICVSGCNGREGFPQQNRAVTLGLTKHPWSHIGGLSVIWGTLGRRGYSGLI